MVFYIYVLEGFFKPYILIYLALLYMFPWKVYDTSYPSHYSLYKVYKVHFDRIIPVFKGFYKPNILIYIALI